LKPFAGGAKNFAGDLFQQLLIIQNQLERHERCFLGFAGLSSSGNSGDREWRVAL
jgi:hypothetical protein